MAGVKLFYSYASADEQLRGELETHLALMRRESLVQTWSFRNIDAGDDWKKTIDANLNGADVILLLISANFIASDYCWDIELKRAIERHEGNDAIVTPIILKPCDWNTAPFARLQALPDGAKPVSSWRPRDRAWENVVTGLRRVVSRRTTAPGLDVQPARELPVDESSAAERGSAVSAARRIVKSAQARNTKEERLRTEGRSAFDREGTAVIESIMRIVSEIQTDFPSLVISAGAKSHQCVVRLGSVTFNMFQSNANPITKALLVGRLWFGGIVLPEEEGKMFYPNKPKEFRNLSYSFDLREDGTWCWHPVGSAEPLASVEVAERCVTHLLEFYEDVEDGRIKFPELSW